MNQKIIIAILGVAVAILVGTTIYFATINKPVETVTSTPQVMQQPAQPIPSQQQQTVSNPVPESAKPTLDKKSLQDAVFTTLCKQTPPAKYLEEIPDRWVSTCKDNIVAVDKVDVSQKAANGKWWAKDAWDWIAWQQDDGKWKVLLSSDGFKCKELNDVPSQYNTFFKDVIYPSFAKGKYCY